MKQSRQQVRSILSFRFKYNSCWARSRAPAFAWSFCECCVYNLQYLYVCTRGAPSTLHKLYFIRLLYHFLILYNFRIALCMFFFRIFIVSVFIWFPFFLSVRSLCARRALIQYYHTHLFIFSSSTLIHFSSQRLCTFCCKSFLLSLWLTKRNMTIKPFKEWCLLIKIFAKQVIWS